MCGDTWRAVINTDFAQPIECFREAIKGINPFTCYRIDGISEFFNHNFFRSDNYI
jgi:hypothetical protein